MLIPSVTGIRGHWLLQGVCHMTKPALGGQLEPRGSPVWVLPLETGKRVEATATGNDRVAPCVAVGSLCLKWAPAASMGCGLGTANPHPAGLLFTNAEGKITTVVGRGLLKADKN